MDAALSKTSLSSLARLQKVSLPRFFGPVAVFSTNSDLSGFSRRPPRPVREFQTKNGANLVVDQFHPKTTASTVYQFRNFVAIFPKLCSPQHSFAFHMIPGRAPPAASDPHAMLSVQIEILINHQLFSKLCKKTLIYVWGNNETFGSDKQECFL